MLSYMLFKIVFFLIFVGFLIANSNAAKGGRGKGRGKGKNILPFPNVNEYSVTGEDRKNVDPRGAKIVKASHFAYNYRLGYKILLICIAEGDPTPAIKWFKDSIELPINMHTHISQKIFSNRDKNRIKSKIEIDPATVGDAGIYTCMANNKFSVMVKNFKADYYF